MPRWNLSKFDDLETPVVSKLDSAPAAMRSATSGQRRTSPLKTVIQIAAMAAVSYSVAVAGSSQVLTIPHEAVRAVSNVDATRPPLEAVFGGRFNDQWTKEKEDALLTEAVKKSAASTEDESFRNFIHTAQHETLDKNAPRLSAEEIKRLRRKA